MINFQKIGMITALINLIAIPETFAVKKPLTEFEKFLENTSSRQMTKENPVEGAIYNTPAFSALPPETKAILILSGLKSIIKSRESGTRAEQNQTNRIYKSKKRKLDEIYN